MRYNTHRNVQSAAPQTSFVAPAVLTLNGSPFGPYAAADKLASLEAAAQPIAFDPICLQRCGKGETFGQEPAAAAATATKVYP